MCAEAGTIGRTADLWGTKIWMSVDGREVLVTAVVSEPDTYQWPDKVLVAMVTNYIGPGVEGRWSDLDEAFDESDYYDREHDNE
jgi:hypothetical protein